MNEDIEKIEAYLNGELSEGERRIFEAAMTSDPALRQEVAAHRVVQEAIVDHELLTVKKEIRNVMDGAGHSHFGRNGRVALGLGGILVAGLLTWWITSPDNVMVSELNEVPVAVDSMVVTDARVPVVPEPSDRNAVLPTEKTRLETHTVPEKTEEPVNHEKNADAATDLVQAGPLQVLPQPVRKKTSDLNVTMPLNSSPKIKPVQPSGTEAGSCFTGMTNDPLLVTDECRTGFVRIAEDWIRRAKDNKWVIMLLPDSVTMKESLQTNLKPGAYRLMISDGRGCQFTRTFIIPVTNARMSRKCFHRAEVKSGPLIPLSILPEELIS